METQIKNITELKTKIQEISGSLVASVEKLLDMAKEELNEEKIEKLLDQGEVSIEITDSLADHADQMSVQLNDLLDVITPEE